MEKVKETIKEHKYKIVVGVPIIVLLLADFGLFNQTSVISAIPRESTVVRLETPITLDLFVESDEPVNAISAIIRYPGDKLEVTSISRENSILDLWAENPTFENEYGVIHFSGGSLKRNGFTGKGLLATVTFLPKKTGKADVRIENALVLAHDGEGTETYEKGIHARYTILGEKEKSPDINNDGKITFADANLIIVKSMSRYEAFYDMNADGKVNSKDTAILFQYLD